MATQCGVPGHARHAHRVSQEPTKSDRPCHSTSRPTGTGNFPRLHPVNHTLVHTCAHTHHKRHGAAIRVRSPQHRVRQCHRKSRRRTLCFTYCTLTPVKQLSSAAAAPPTTERHQHRTPRAPALGQRACSASPADLPPDPWGRWSSSSPSGCSGSTRASAAPLPPPRFGRAAPPPAPSP